MTLAERSPAGSSVITVTATDKDSGENGRITYRVVSTKDMFYIEPSNGKLSFCSCCFPFVYCSSSKSLSDVEFILKEQDIIFYIVVLKWFFFRAHILGCQVAISLHIKYFNQQLNLLINNFQQK